MIAKSFSSGSSASIGSPAPLPGTAFFMPNAQRPKSVLCSAPEMQAVQ